MQTLPFRRIGHGSFLLLLFFACQKHQEKTLVSALPTNIQSARSFFDNAVVTSAIPLNTANYRARLRKTVRWDLAQTTSLAGQVTIVAPVQYTGPIYVSSDLTKGEAFELGSLTRLVISRDTNQAFHYALLTYFPDSNTIRSQTFNTGILFSEDWQGNSMSKPLHMDAQGRLIPANTPINGSKQIDIIQNIQVCNEIDGYNYSPDDPTAGSSWSETSCTMYQFQSPTSAGSTGPPNLGAYLVSRPAPLTINLSAPSSPIANIADYFKCFTPGDASHNFTVTLAVEQPDQGTRQPWTFTSGGVSGSSQTGNPINVGHSFLIFSEGSGGQLYTQRSVGFYPQGIVTPFSTSAQGVLGNDQYTDYNICLTISVSSSQFFTMLQYVTQGNNSGYMYDLNSNNCTTFALDAIDAGGISIPSTIGYWVGNGQGLDPGDLGEDIRNMQLPGNMTRNTVSNSHPNVGTCN